MGWGMDSGQIVAIGFFAGAGAAGFFVAPDTLRARNSMSTTSLRMGGL